MRVYLGGTFNPIHLGHLTMLAEAVSLLQADCGYLLPCKVSPFKQPKPEKSVSELDNNDVHHRLTMLRLAIADYPTLRIDTRELDSLREPSYTIDTLKEIHSETVNDVNDAIVFVMGADSWQGLCGWKDWQQLLNYANLLVFNRLFHQQTIDIKKTPAYDYYHEQILPINDFVTKVPTIQTQNNSKRNIKGFISFSEMQQPCLAESSIIRQQIEQQTIKPPTEPIPISKDIPKSVQQYIQTHQLYQATND